MGRLQREIWEEINKVGGFVDGSLFPISFTHLKSSNSRCETTQCITSRPFGEVLPEIKEGMEWKRDWNIKMKLNQKQRQVSLNRGRN